MPELSRFSEAWSELNVGAMTSEPGELELNAGRRTFSLKVTNGGDRPIQVGSHYHFSETNRALAFDRQAAVGMRLDIPAGMAVRFEPGSWYHVSLVEIAGLRVVRGGNALIDGPVQGATEVGIRAAAMGFAHVRSAAREKPR